MGCRAGASAADFELAENQGARNQDLGQAPEINQ